MKKYILVYTAGVLTTPTVVLIFRQPIAKKVGHMLIDEKFDEPLFRFMTRRLDLQDLRKAQQRKGKRR